MKVFRKDIKRFGSKEDVIRALELFKEADAGSASYTQSRLAQNGYRFNIYDVLRMEALDKRYKITGRRA